MHCLFLRFCRGLATLGVLAELKIHGNRMKELFVHEERPLDATTLEILFNLELSEANSNRRRAEEVVVSNWRDFLLDLEGIISSQWRLSSFLKQYNIDQMYCLILRTRLSKLKLDIYVISNTSTKMHVHRPTDTND